MKKQIFTLVIVSLFSVVQVLSQDKPNDLVLKRVNVIPMDREVVLKNQTVLIKNGVIAEIKPFDEIVIPEGVKIIDAKHGYLIPGLTDMHMHLISDDRIPKHFAKHELPIPVTFGVTRARIPIGRIEHLELKEQIRGGQILGPEIHIAGHIAEFMFNEHTEGIKVSAPTEARAAVRQLKREGYESIKITFVFSEELFNAITDEAKKVGLQVFGHVPEEVGIRKAIASGYHIEHLDQYFEDMLPDSIELRSVSGIGLVRNQGYLDFLTQKKMSNLAQLTAKAKVWNTPTNAFFIRAFGLGFDNAEYWDNPGYRFLPPDVIDELIPQFYWENPPDETERNLFIKRRLEFVKALHDAGAGLLAGSDSPEGVLLYGYGLHYELQRFVEAGLTPFEALKTATVNPAIFMSKAGEFGSIIQDAKADLVLLEKNPLDDISNIQSIKGIILQGTWFSLQELHQIRKTSYEKLGESVLRD